MSIWTVSATAARNFRVAASSNPRRPFGNDASRIAAGGMSDRALVTSAS
jgi:hypothetical protein